MDKQKFRIGNYKKLIRVVVVFAVAVYCIITVISQQITMNQQQAKHDELLSKQTALSANVEELQRKLEYVNSLSYAEQTVREKLGWVKDGEIIFKIAPETQSNADDSQSQQNDNAQDQITNNQNEPNGNIE